MTDATKLSGDPLISPLSKAMLAQWYSNERLGQYEYVFVNPDGTGEMLAFVSWSAANQEKDALKRIQNECLDGFSSEASHE